MQMKNLSKLTLLGVAAGFLIGCNSPKKTDQKPNIIFIMADDLGYGDLSCFGQKVIKTPNLDQMAAEGIMFTQHYAGNTVCAPSRCSLMTGLHMGHAEVRGNRQATRTIRSTAFIGRGSHSGKLVKRCRL